MRRIARRITTHELVGLGGGSAGIYAKRDEDWPAWVIDVQADDLDGLERVLWALEQQTHNMLRAVREERANQTEGA